MLELIKASNLLKKIKKIVSIGAILVALILAIAFFVAIFKGLLSNIIGFGILVIVGIIKVATNNLG